MITKIKVSTPYDVVISEGALEKLGTFIKPVVKGDKAIIITDKNIASIYLEEVKNKIQAEGLEVYSHIIEPGEIGKCFSTYEDILFAMKSASLSRKDAVIALGGGVVGDVAGFAASSYQRGLTFVQIPTTLLAMVDSSIGGKTAINFQNDKNQIGTFYQPSLVICDLKFLDTLPECEFSNGYAEIIKYAVIADKNLFDIIKKKDIKDNLEEVISRCIKIKKKFIESDEQDNGSRMMLNFGHTIGHAIESFTDGHVPHGEAVAIGMAYITYRAARLGHCSYSTFEKLISVIKKYNLSCDLLCDIGDLHSHILCDKKSIGDNINLVIPKRIGKCVIKTVKAPGNAVVAPPSKSYEHRLLIGEFLSGSKIHRATSLDAKATARCLNSLRKAAPGKIVKLNCVGSASTLRFLMPIVCALGINAKFIVDDSLFKRPHDELIQTLINHGASITKVESKKGGGYILCSGRIFPGSYEISGNVSSQYITGLLFALPLLDEESTLKITTRLSSSPYISITEDVLTKFGISFKKVQDTYTISGNQVYTCNESLDKASARDVQGDWSLTAALLCIGAISDIPVSVSNLEQSSLQGDKKILEVLKDFGAQINIDNDIVTVSRGEKNAFTFNADDAPDLAPVVSTLAVLGDGTTTITGINRLRIKECDRAEAICNMINTVGGSAIICGNAILINPAKNLVGGKVKTYNDHRIAMSAAILRTVCPVDIDDEKCIKKSYPGFRKDLDALFLK